MKMENLQIKMFAQRLADNLKPTRDKALKMLRKHFKICSALGECFELDVMLNIWKGLFYSMYMSDKSLTQEALAEDISQLLHVLVRKNDKKCFIEAAFQTFAREWLGIDVFRVDKMMMFVRRMLRQSLIFLKRLEWCKEDAIEVVNIFENCIICPSDNTNTRPLGLKLHFCDIYLEELAKVGGENLDHSIILLFLQPYIKVLALSNINPYIQRVNERVMQHLIRQSDLGIAEGEGLLAGDRIQVEVDSDDDNDEEPMEQDDEGNDSVLDPRAGGVDVYLPQLNVNYENLAEDLQAMGSLKEIKQKKRSLLYRLATQMRDLAGGVYPFSIADDMDTESYNIQKESTEAIHRLQKYEKKLRAKYDIGKKRKRSNNSCTQNNENKLEHEMMEEESGKLSEFQSLKKKVKRKNKQGKNKNNTDKANINTKKELSKQVVLKNCVEEKLKAICEKAGIPSPKSTISKGQLMQPMEFVVTDISTPTKQKETKKASTSPISITPMETNDFTPNTESSSPGWNISSEDKVNVPKSPIPSGLSLNFSTERNVQLGFKPQKTPSLWDEPLKDGEFEYTVKSRKQILRERMSDKKNNKSMRKDKISKNRRRSLSFNLKENTEHLFSDYTRSVRSSPSIPFNADKLPGVSVLKPSPSPILVRKPLLKTLSKSPRSLVTPRIKKLKRLSMPTFVV